MELLNTLEQQGIIFLEDTSTSLGPVSVVPKVVSMAFGRAYVQSLASSNLVHNFYTIASQD